MVRMINTLDEFKAVLTESGGKLVVVDFTATWCGPCKMIGPKFEALSEVNRDVVFLKVDVDEASDVAQHYKINCMPTFKFFKNGQQVAEIQGADLGALTSKIQEHK